MKTVVLTDPAGFDHSSTWPGVSDFRAAAALGRLPGASSLVLRGVAQLIQTVEAPCLVWDARTAYAFQASPVLLEILSGSASDAAAGTGARTVLIDGLDAEGNVQTAIATLNGVTPVAVPTLTWSAVNFITVIAAGSGGVNAGLLTVRVAGAGAVQGSVLAGVGIQRAMKYTVPTGYQLIIDNFYVNANNPGGANTLVTVDFNVRTLAGVTVKSQTHIFSGTGGPASITLNTGVVTNAGNTFYMNISTVSANNANFVSSVNGILVPLTL